MWGEVFLSPTPFKVIAAKKNRIYTSRMTIENQFTVFGGYSVGVTPVLIPNTAVKSYSADDTALETMWESRSPPKLFKRPQLIICVGGVASSSLFSPRQIN